MPRVRALRSPSRTDDGFTLIEALMAIVVLMVGLVALVNLFAMAATSNTVSRQATASAATAAATLEALKAQRFETLAAGGDVLTSQPGFSSEDDVPGVGVIRTRWRITAVDPQAVFIEVRAEGTSPLSSGRSRAELATLRSCTAESLGCPSP